MREYIERFKPPPIFNYRANIFYVYILQYLFFKLFLILNVCGKKIVFQFFYWNIYIFFQYLNALFTTSLADFEGSFHIYMYRNVGE